MLSSLLMLCGFYKNSCKSASSVGCSSMLSISVWAFKMFSSNVVPERGNPSIKVIGVSQAIMGLNSFCFEKYALIMKAYY
jgi:hypothetical protein